ncbi:MAG TPA: hypothetical protein VEJ84_06045, partial [Acidimicrobiales bacterium]|nr:hypothetical protein [Acidimicrobiales bacterium]
MVSTRFIDELADPDQRRPVKQARGFDTHKIPAGAALGPTVRAGAVPGDGRTTKRRAVTPAKRLLGLIAAGVTASTLVTSFSIIPASASATIGLVAVGAASTNDVTVNLFGGTHQDGSTVADPQSGCVPNSVGVSGEQAGPGGIDNGLPSGCTAGTSAFATTVYNILPGLNDDSVLAADTDCQTPGAASTGTAMVFNGTIPSGSQTPADTWGALLNPNGASSNDAAEWPTAAGTPAVYGGGSGAAPATTTAPNGATDGKRALYSEVGGYTGGAPNGNGTSTPIDTGCFDIGRSSSSPSPSTTHPYDNSNAEYYAFALDAVSVIVGSAATANLPPGEPATLTLQQIWNIYTCQV